MPGIHVVKAKSQHLRPYGLAVPGVESLALHKTVHRRPSGSHYLMPTLGSIKKGDPVSVKYDGPAVIYMIEGEYHLVEKSKHDEIVKLFAGDIASIDDGSFVTFSSPNSGKAFSAIYTSTSYLPEDLVAKVIHFRSF